MDCSGPIYDVICLHESWLHSGYPDSILSNGLDYSVFRCDRSSGRGSGCTILAKYSLSASHVNLPLDFASADVQVVAIEIYILAVSLLLYAVYITLVVNVIQV